MPTLPDANLRFPEALDWRKWTKTGRIQGPIPSHESPSIVTASAVGTAQFCSSCHDDSHGVGALVTVAVLPL